MRIVSLVPSATEIVVALGLGDSLVGVTHSCDYPPDLGRPTVTSTSILSDAPSAEIDRRVREGVAAGEPLYDLDLALLEELRPDLVVTQGVCEVCAVGERQLVAGLEGLSLQLEVVSLHPHRFEDVLADVLRLGAAAGVGERAGEVVQGLRARVDAVRARLATVEPVSVAVLEWLDPLYSAGHWTPDVVALAGGRERLARPGDRSRELEWDEVLAADPEALLLACCGQGVGRTLDEVHLLEQRVGFASLRAVRDGRVYVADGGAHFSRPGPRLVDSLELLAESLHPCGAPGAAGLTRWAAALATPIVRGDRPSYGAGSRIPSHPPAVEDTS